MIYNDVLEAAEQIKRNRGHNASGISFSSEGYAKAQAEVTDQFHPFQGELYLNLTVTVAADQSKEWILS